MGHLGEPMALQNPVKFSEVPGVECHQSPCPEDRLVLVEFCTVGMGDGQGPEEPAESLDVPGLLEGLADRGHLADGEVEGGQEDHGVVPGNGSWLTQSQSHLVAVFHGRRKSMFLGEMICIGLFEVLVGVAITCRRKVLFFICVPVLVSQCLFELFRKILFVKRITVQAYLIVQPYILYANSFCPP